MTRSRLGDADGVAHLHQSLRRKSGCDDVLCHVAGGVGGRAVDLGRILARERATAVRRRTAIGVDDDLAAGQAAVALRAADDEAAGRVDQILDFALDQFGRQHRLDDVFDHRFADGFERHVRRVLGRQHDGVDAVRLAVDVADGDLAFGVRTQPRQTAVLAQHRLAFDQTVRQVDRSGISTGVSSQA
jgi:hypothetical protein